MRISRNHLFHGIMRLGFDFPVPSSLPLHIFFFSTPLFIPSLSMAEAHFRPALTVFNIKNHILIVLEIETEHYTACAELFKLHSRSHRVLVHIIPPAKSTDKEKSPTDKEIKSNYGVYLMPRSFNGTMPPYPPTFFTRFLKLISRQWLRGLVIATSFKTTKPLVWLLLNKTSLT